MTRHSFRFSALLVIALLPQLGVSCVSDGGGSDTNDRYDSTSSHNSSFDRPKRIPRSADIVREGTGKLKWKADLDGSIYVYDRDQDVVRYKGNVRRGQEVVVQPDDDKVFVAAQVVCDEDLRKDSYHALFFTTGDRDGRKDDHGSHNDRADDLPKDAKRLARGSDGVKIAKAPADGVVYVFDEDNRRVLQQTSIRRGAMYQVAPSEGAIYLDGKRIDQMRFERGHTLSLYFVDKS